MVDNDIENEILNDPSASAWIKEQIVMIGTRDIVDALNDVELLQDLLNKRFDKMQAT